MKTEDAVTMSPPRDLGVAMALLTPGLREVGVAEVTATWGHEGGEELLD